MIRLILKDRGVGGEEEAEPWFLTPPPAFWFCVQKRARRERE
jgi:hypothetical protein